MTEYKNLDMIRQMMSQKSPSNFKSNVGQSTTNDLDLADASGCLMYISRHTPTDNPNLMRTAVACYVQDDKRQAFYDEVVKLAQNGYQSKRLRKKHAKNLAKAVVIDTMQCALTDKQKAKTLGITKSTFCEHHAKVFDQLSGGSHG
ncbi:MAG: hypothetical protein Q4A69_09330 [Moraxella sp.]|nr:hypothetical protein [Moraxella sp.]